MFVVVLPRAMTGVVLPLHAGTHHQCQGKQEKGQRRGEDEDEAGADGPVQRTHEG